MTIVPAGAKGVDFSFAHPPPARLVELGYRFVVGYLSVPPASPAKNLSKTECEAYVAAGLAVLLVWEMSATRASLGAPYGVLDGANAKLMALARGYPQDVPILVADDTNTVATNIDTHEAYMRAFAVACAPYPIGIYGDTDILTRCAGLWRIGWLPNAWSWSGASKAQAEAKARALGAHVLQRTGFYIDNTWAVDPNDAIADFPAWGTTPNPLPPQEDDMITEADIWKDSVNEGDKFVLKRDDGRFRPISETELNLLGIGPLTAALGKPVSKADRDTLDAVAGPPFVIPPIVVPPITGHIVADLGAGGHITGSIG